MSATRGFIREKVFDQQTLLVDTLRTNEEVEGIQDESPNVGSAADFSCGLMGNHRMNDVRTISRDSHVRSSVRLNSDNSHRGA